MIFRKDTMKIWTESDLLLSQRFHSNFYDDINNYVPPTAFVCTVSTQIIFTVKTLLHSEQKSGVPRIQSWYRIILLYCLSECFNILIVNLLKTQTLKAEGPCLGHQFTWQRFLMSLASLESVKAGYWSSYLLRAWTALRLSTHRWHNRALKK